MTQVSELTREAIIATEAPTGWGGPGATLRDGLTSKGINVLGAGHYGAAIEENGEVFKIYGAPEKGYDRFVKYATGKRSVLLPRMSPVGQFGNWKVVHVEHLYSLDSVLGTDVANELGGWINYSLTSKLDKRGVSHRGWWVTKVKFPKDAEAIVNRANLIGLLTKMIDVMVAINAEGGKTVRFDVHRENVMVRKNADGTMQLVLTDPWADND